MNARRVSSEFLVTILIVSLPFVALPAPAADAPATLTGSIVRVGDQSPLAGARLHVGDPKSGKLFSSTPADEDGGFALADLPPATYSLAVESEGGLYVVETPLSLAPGAARTLTLAVNPEPMNRKRNSDDDDSDDGPVFSFKENPLTATLLMLGIATAIGILIDDDDSGPRQVSPTEPD